MAQARTLVAVEQFRESYASKKSPSYELVNGELVDMALPGGIHGGIAAILATALDNHVRQNRAGCVVVDTEYHFEHDPDTVRGPDVSFISTERLPSGWLPRGFVEGQSGLSVDGVSPSDTANEVEAEGHDYLRTGTRRVGVVYYGPVGF